MNSSTRISENLLMLLLKGEDEERWWWPISTIIFVQRERKGPDGTLVSSDGVFITGGEVYFKTADIDST